MRNLFIYLLTTISSEQQNTKAYHVIPSILCRFLIIKSNILFQTYFSRRIWAFVGCLLRYESRLYGIILIIIYGMRRAVDIAVIYAFDASANSLLDFWTGEQRDIASELDEPQRIARTCNPIFMYRFRASSSRFRSRNIKSNNISSTAPKLRGRHTDKQQTPTNHPSSLEAIE